MIGCMSYWWSNCLPEKKDESWNFGRTEREPAVCYWCLALEALTDESDLPRSATAVTTSPGAVDIQYGENTPSLPSSLSSDATTVNRWATPPSRFQSPATSFQHPRDSTEEPLIRAARTSAHRHPIDTMVQFDEEHIRSLEAEASKRERKMDDRFEDESVPTPNNDDTPFIRFAIDQLTRDEEEEQRRKRNQQTQQQNTSDSSDDYPVERIIPHENRAYIPQRPTRAELALVRKHRSTPGPRLFGFNSTRPLSTQPPTEENTRQPINYPTSNNTSDLDIFIPEPTPSNARRYPELKFIPTIIRPISLIIVTTLCLLMTAAIMFCAIYTLYHDGLAKWDSGIYSGRYFIFGFLPQMVGACIFVYVQCILAAITRIMPYTLMAMEDAQHRNNALFLDVVPRHMLWPKWEGPTMINIANLCMWLSVFTIPLLGCLFSVILVEGQWKWTAVQGIAWALVAIYILMCMGFVLVGAFFFGRVTGLLWDPRSLADVIALLPRSNSLRDYSGTEIMKTRKELKLKLADRSDRLGYWRTPNPTQEVFYAIGENGAPTRRYTLEGGKVERKFSGKHDLEENPSGLYDSTARFRYIPWFLKDTYVVLWCVTAFFLLLALIIISFLPSTAVRKGFAPQVLPGPNGAGYSAANFLYSFIPAIIGMILYLVFQPIDMAFRKLQPWRELANPNGATAEKSILLDYTATLPISTTFSALGNAHYRVAWFSFASLLFILLPVLAGGIFFPLTTPSGEVRMLPNLSSFYVCLVVLIIYFLTLLLLLPSRKNMYLPHKVDCPAEIISFVHSSRLLDDAAFRAPRSKADLITRLMSISEHFRGGEARFALGVGFGRGGKEVLGIERLGRRGEEEVMVLG
ncbi:phosphoribosylaminoimidazole-succinocarboxamide synthase protein [Rutstroemia sp. NJR-2017a BVV2]|nr:phosphoribosylaminoimidazole-succinocarboxamide synthase protein [Rutstroemia sp. NJR-2017a BVV2]